MTFDELQTIRWLEPWEPADAGLETELAKEVSAGHPSTFMKYPIEASIPSSITE